MRQYCRSPRQAQQGDCSLPGRHGKGRIAAKVCAPLFNRLVRRASPQLLLGLRNLWRAGNLAQKKVPHAQRAVSTRSSAVSSVRVDEGVGAQVVATAKFAPHFRFHLVGQELRALPHGEVGTAGHQECPNRLPVVLHDPPESDDLGIVGRLKIWPGAPAELQEQCRGGVSNQR